MELKSLNEIFEKGIFRIPDYQRGYAWQKEQLRDFWEDLINIENEEKVHYTGMLTMKNIPKEAFKKEEEEYWLLDEHGYRAYHVVDGQQRLTTSIILIQAIVDVLREMPEHAGKKEEEIYIGSIKLPNIKETYLVKEREPDRIVKTYKFGYTVDNPSFKYLRHQILGEKDGGTITETFYTLNLYNAKKYFKGQLQDLLKREGVEGLRSIYKKVTQQLKFNQYIIGKELDVFVAFETMNNRGKKLSNLELLKNRLIYLTTLYPDRELKADARKKLRDEINDAWKEIYHQLGRNKQSPLNDDDFLKAHWIMYFKYSRSKGNDYIRDLLNEQFSTKKIQKKREVFVETIDAEEVTETPEIDEDWTMEEVEENGSVSDLSPEELSRFVGSIKSASSRWFFTHFPFWEDDNEYSAEERAWLDKLNRIGIAYFRPLVMSLLLTEKNPEQRVAVLKVIERFIFICFRLDQVRSNYRDSEFYNAARELYYGQIDSSNVVEKIDNNLWWCNEEDGRFKTSYFEDFLKKKFDSKNPTGYYGWSALRYFLYEYELSLAAKRGQHKIHWNLFVKHERDEVSIEHILPQTPDEPCWKQAFKGLGDKKLTYLKGSLGNLLPLSMSINASLQNDCFVDKKQVQHDADGVIIRHGYANGSYSEIEVAELPEWTPEGILKRGLQLLKFMEKRWDIKLGSEEEKKKLLFLSFME
jgi:uncharacterized protein with ParB-like and HNH nuclease domain